MLGHGNMQFAHWARYQANFAHATNFDGVMQTWASFAHARQAKLCCKRASLKQALRMQQTLLRTFSTGQTLLMADKLNFAHQAHTGKLYSSNKILVAPCANGQTLLTHDELNFVHQTNTWANFPQATNFGGTTRQWPHFAHARQTKVSSVRCTRCSCKQILSMHGKQSLLTMQTSP